MLTTVYKISVMYFASVILMRAAGKREVAQLEVSELVTSFMVSEIACMPITDPDVPLKNAVVFIMAVISLEIILTRLSMKIPFFKHMVIGKPSFLITKGKLDKTALSKAGVSLSELVSAMRKNGIASLDKINYAIQEPDGTISIFSCDDGSSGLQHMLICDGRLNKTEMKTFGYSKEDVKGLIKKEGVDEINKVFFLGVDDTGDFFVIKK